MLEEIKQWILVNLYKNSKQISKRIRLDWFEKFGFLKQYDLIYEYTKFLPDGFKLGMRVMCIVRDITKHPTCKECGVPTKKRYSSEMRGFVFCDFCSPKCTNTNKEIQDKIKNTNIKTYGVPYTQQNKEVRKKGENTNLERYGFVSPMHNASVKLNLKNKIIELFGVDNVSKLESIKQKKIETSNLNYGCDFPTQHTIVKNRIKTTNKEKYGTDNPQQNKDIRKKTVITRKTLSFELITKSDDFRNFKFNFDLREFIESKNQIFSIICNVCNVNFKWKRKKQPIPKCPCCNKQLSSISKSELELQNFIQSFIPTKIETNIKRILDKKFELDIYLKDYNLAIEFNGLYWHSEILGRRNKHYHLNKTNECLSKGITLLHIFEDDWIYCKNVIKNKLLKYFGMLGLIKYEKLQIKPISQIEFNNFSIEHDSYLTCVHDIYYGVFGGGNIVGVVGIDGNMISKIIEISTHSIDNFHKHVFNFFKNLNINFIKLDSASDVLMESRLLFLNLITNKQTTDPTFYYINKNKRYIPTNIADNSNLDRIWDCGTSEYDLI